jgi:hypothetical protein
MIKTPSDFYISWYENWLIHVCPDQDPYQQRERGVVNWEPSDEGHKCDRCKKSVDPKIVFMFKLKDFFKPGGITEQEYEEYNRDP